MTEDKKDAQKRQAISEDETKPLGGTTWQVVSSRTQTGEVPQVNRHEFQELTVLIVTTKTNMDGDVETLHEQYRVVGSTLIIYKSDYVENTKFTLEGDKLIIDYGNDSLVLQRVS